MQVTASFVILWGMVRGGLTSLSGTSSLTIRIELLADRAAALRHRPISITLALPNHREMQRTTEHVYGSAVRCDGRRRSTHLESLTDLLQSITSLLHR